MSESDTLPARFRKNRFTTPELSEYLLLAHGLSVAPATLEKKRCVGGGPPFQRAGRAVLYPRDMADDWAIELLGTPVMSTSEAGR